MLQSEQADNSVLTTLFHHNTWANLKLLDVCAALSEAQLDTTATGTYGSIRDTLRHIVRGEVSYVQRVNGRLPAEPPPWDGFPGFAVLKAAVRWAGDELLLLAQSARADTLVNEYDPDVKMTAQYPLADLIVQAITHSTEHRTQVSTILTQLGLEPPDMSGWQYMVEAGEFREIAETES